MAKSKQIRIGSQVRFTRKNGEFDQGKLTGYTSRPNGVWAAVRVGSGKSATMCYVRPSQLGVI